MMNERDMELAVRTAKALGLDFQQVIKLSFSDIIEKLVEVIENGRAD